MRLLPQIPSLRGVELVEVHQGQPRTVARAGSESIAYRAAGFGLSRGSWRVLSGQSVADERAGGMRDARAWRRARVGFVCRGWIVCAEACGEFWARSCGGLGDSGDGGAYGEFERDEWVSGESGNAGVSARRGEGRATRFDCGGPRRAWDWARRQRHCWEELARRSWCTFRAIRRHWARDLRDLLARVTQSKARRLLTCFRRRFTWRRWCGCAGDRRCAGKHWWNPEFPDRLFGKFNLQIWGPMHQDNLDPARRTHGLTAVPLFHAAWQFAAGIVLAGRLSIQPPLLLVMLALVAALCGVAVSRDGAHAANCVAAAGSFVGDAGSVVRGDGAATCGCARAGCAF